MWCAPCAAAYRAKTQNASFKNRRSSPRADFGNASLPCNARSFANVSTFTSSRVFPCVNVTFIALLCSVEDTCGPSSVSFPKDTAKGADIFTGLRFPERAAASDACARAHALLSSMPTPTISYRPMPAASSLRSKALSLRAKAGSGITGSNVASSGASAAVYTPSPSLPFASRLCLAFAAAEAAAALRRAYSHASKWLHQRPPMVFPHALSNTAATPATARCRAASSAGSGTRGSSASRGSPWAKERATAFASRAVARPSSETRTHAFVLDASMARGGRCSVADASSSEPVSSESASESPDAPAAARASAAKSRPPVCALRISANRASMSAIAGGREVRRDTRSVGSRAPKASVGRARASAEVWGRSR